MPANRVFLRLGSGQRPEKVEELKFTKMENVELKELSRSEMLAVDGGLKKWQERVLGFLLGVAIGFVIDAA